MSTEKRQTDLHPTPHPTSPWTEIFQQADAQPERAKTQRSQAHAPAQSDSARPTRDALSAIFNKH